MSSDQALAKALSGIWATGLVFIKGVPSDPSSVQKLAERIALLRNTFYGTTWDVRSKPNAENVAYTSRYLGYHMDLLYMKEPPGLQLLHCIENTCKGGESFFADTFTAVHHLLREDQGIYPHLSNNKIRYAYHNGCHSFANTRALLDSGLQEGRRLKRYQGNLVSREVQNIQRVYWSPPFVSSEMVRPSEASYDKENAHKQKAALKAFETTLNRPDLRVETKLPPGTCAIFDNLRIVHAREAFDTNSGHRWLRGAYLDWQEFVSKANSLVDIMPKADSVTLGRTYHYTRI